MQNSTPSTLLKIKQLYPTFSGKYRNIASHILEHPEDVVQDKVRDVASSCGCDDAQVVRFCQKIGYKGFSEMKAAIAADFIPVKTNIDFSNPAQSDTFSQLKEDFRQSNLRVLNDTVALLEEKQIRQAVVQLNRAEKISLCGIGSSGLVARDFQIKLSRMGFHAVFEADSDLNRMYCGLLTPKDAMVAISFSGENKNVCAYAAEARRHGASVIAITNFPESTLAQCADVTLLTASEEQRFRLGAMGSRIAQLLVVDLLSLELALNDLKRTEENVLRTHEMIEEK